MVSGIFYTSPPCGDIIGNSKRVGGGGGGGGFPKFSKEAMNLKMDFIEGVGNQISLVLGPKTKGQGYGYF